MGLRIQKVEIPPAGHSLRLKPGWTMREAHWTEFAGCLLGWHQKGRCKHFGWGLFPGPKTSEYYV